MRPSTRPLLAFALALATTSAAAAPCAGFTDVDTSSTFCNNVAWVKNRTITFGCNATQYCPNDPVSRLQMAAFLNRLGNALTPTVVQATENLSGSFAMPKRMCATTDVPAAAFPRRVLVDAWFNFVDPDANETMFAEIEVSTDSGASYGDFIGAMSVFQSVPQGTLTTQSAQMAATGGFMELVTGVPYRFSVVVTAIEMAASTVGVRCSLRAQVVNRTSSSPPFD